MVLINHILNQRSIEKMKGEKNEKIIQSVFSINNGLHISH